MAAKASVSRSTLSPLVWLFVSLMVCAGVGFPATLIGDWHIHLNWGVAAYFALAVLASQWKVRLPGTEISQTVLLVAVIFGICQMTGAETLITTLVGTFVQCIWKARTRPKPVQLVFNLSVAAGSVAICSSVYHSVALRRVGLDPASILLVTSAVLYLLNTAPIAVIISLAEGGRWMEVWREKFLWSFPFYLVGAVVAELIKLTGQFLGWNVAVLMSPVVYIVFRGYRVFIGRMEDEKRHSDELTGLHMRTIETLALAIEAKDQTTANHLARVQTYALAVGEEIGMDRDQLDALRAAAFLHDIGKLAVPEYIISKPGKLTPEEFEKMKIHPAVGAEILERVKFPYPVTPIVRSHHEKWNGTGYPDGLAGEAIPLGARILGAVDCLDALASDRQYRPALPLDEAMARVEAESGISFDPAVVVILKRRYRELEESARTENSERAVLSVGVPVKAGAAPAAGFEVSAPVAQPAEARSIDVMATVAAARQEMLDLFEVCQDLGASLSLQETLSVFEARLKRLVPFDCLAVYLTRNFRLIPEYVCGENSRLFASLEIPFGNGLSGWVAENGKSIVNGNPAVEPGYLSDPTKFTTMRSAIAVPVREAGNVIAVLTLYSGEREAFSQENLRILGTIEEKLARAISCSLRLRQLENTSLVDPLTGISNARALFLHLHSELQRCSRTGSELTLVVGNLNGFSEVNEKLGHQAGNDLLKRVASKLRECCRPYDFVARTGGDHFAIAIPELDPEGLERRVLELEAAVEEISAGEGLSLSMSTGVSSAGADGMDPDQLVSVAGKRLLESRTFRDGSAEAATLTPALVA